MAATHQLSFPLAPARLWIGVWGFLAGMTMTIACSPSAGDSGVPVTAPDFSGFISVIEPTATGEAIGSVLVESHADKLLHRYLVDIAGDTEIISRIDAVERRIPFSALETRNWVEVWFKGSPSKPSPGGRTARVLLVVDRLSD